MREKLSTGRKTNKKTPCNTGSDLEELRITHQQATVIIIKLKNKEKSVFNLKLSSNFKLINMEFTLTRPAHVTKYKWGQESEESRITCTCVNEPCGLLCIFSLPVTYI